MRSLFVLLVCAGVAHADFMIVPAIENDSGNWQVLYDEDVPPPPLTVYAEFTKRDGRDAVRATLEPLGYQETGLHVITAANAGQYGFAWNSLRSALTDPTYTEFAIGWNDERRLIRWHKPLTATATEWWLRVQRYETADISPFGITWLSLTTHVRGTAATYDDTLYYPRVPEPSGLLLMLCWFGVHARSWCIRRR